MEQNRPDIMVSDEKKTVLIIDFTVPQDNGLTKAYAEKISRYEALK